MATAEQIAEFDTRLKLRFERKFRPKMNRIFIGVAKDVAAEIARGGAGSAGLVALGEAQIETELAKHYNDVAKTFSRKISGRLPSSVAATGAERAVIQAELEATFAARAASQAQRIAGTTAKNIATSVNATLASGDTLLDNRTLGRKVGAQLARHFRKRATSIATVETQFPAETAKETELQVLTGTATNVTKKWVSQADSRVRDSHLAADGQVVLLNQPFLVQGELLKYPGDPSGSASNVINCRCASVTNTDDIVALRGA